MERKSPRLIEALMREEAERFRMRARKRRDVAGQACDSEWPDQLTANADELEQEADRIDAKESVR